MKGYGKSVHHCNKHRNDGNFSSVPTVYITIKTSRMTPLTCNKGITQFQIPPKQHRHTSLQQLAHSSFESYSQQLKGLN
jgi:hypothetical protein